MKGLLEGGEVVIKRKSISRLFVMLFLSGLMILSNTLVVSAAVNNENSVSPQNTNISFNTVNLTISGIKANCSANLRANKSVNLKIVMELQKKKSNGYKTVETWTDSKSGTYIAMSESRNINLLCTYRLKVTFTAGNETEVVYKYK